MYPMPPPSNPSRYTATGAEAEFEPGSRSRVMRNLLGITRVGDMQRAESEALEAIQLRLLEQFGPEHRFTAQDICTVHRLWLGAIYPWAGDYRQVNLAKQGFMFAAAAQVPRLIADLERRWLSQHTSCAGMDETRLVQALATTHAELVIIHPFREGNGRCARLLAWLMALQAGTPSLNFSPMQGRGKAAYIQAINAAFMGDERPMRQVFSRVLAATWRSVHRLQAQQHGETSGPG